MERDFSTTGINQKWCTYITYIYTIKDGWTYLASAWIYTAKKSYANDTSMTADYKKAVENSCLNKKLTEVIIIHSDLGSQYTSQTFEDYITSKQVIHSFRRKGNPMIMLVLNLSIPY